MTTLVDSDVGAQSGIKTSPLDEAAFESLHGRTSRALWSYLRRLTGDPSVADDVHQESYLRYIGRPCPAEDERRQSAYLFRIATNLVHDRWRLEKRERNWLQQLLDLRKTTYEGSLSVDFESVFNRLKPRQRALLWLAYVEGYSHHEIADVLGLKAGSIKVLLFRARRQLAELLKENGLTAESSPLQEVTT